MIKRILLIFFIISYIGLFMKVFYNDYDIAIIDHNMKIVRGKMDELIDDYNERFGLEDGKIN